MKQRLAVAGPGRDEVGQRQADEQAQDRPGDRQRQAGDERVGVPEDGGVVVEGEAAGVAAGLASLAEAEDDDDRRAAAPAGPGTRATPGSSSSAGQEAGCGRRPCAGVAGRRRCSAASPSARSASVDRRRRQPPMLETELLPDLDPERVASRRPGAPSSLAMTLVGHEDGRVVEDRRVDELLGLVVRRRVAVVFVSLAWISGSLDEVEEGVRGLRVRRVGRACTQVSSQYSVPSLGTMYSCPSVSGSAHELVEPPVQVRPRTASLGPQLVLVRVGVEGEDVRREAHAAARGPPRAPSGRSS